MQRDILLIAEMIDAATQAALLVNGVDAGMHILHTTATDQLPDFTEQLREVLGVLESEDGTG